MGRKGVDKGDTSLIMYYILCITLYIKLACDGYWSDQSWSVSVLNHVLLN